MRAIAPPGVPTGRARPADAHGPPIVSQAHGSRSPQVLVKTQFQTDDGPGSGRADHPHPVGGFGLIAVSYASSRAAVRYITGSARHLAETPWRAKDLHRDRFRSLPRGSPLLPA